MFSTRITPDIKIHKKPNFNVRNEIHFIGNSAVLTSLKVFYTVLPDDDLI